MLRWGWVRLCNFNEAPSYRSPVREGGERFDGSLARQSNAAEANPDDEKPSGEK